jgi:hypothetical protein
MLGDKTPLDDLAEKFIAIESDEVPSPTHACSTSTMQRVRMASRKAGLLAWKFLQSSRSEGRR